MEINKRANELIKRIPPEIFPVRKLIIGLKPDQGSLTLYTTSPVDVLKKRLATHNDVEERNPN